MNTYLAVRQRYAPRMFRQCDIGSVNILETVIVNPLTDAEEEHHEVAFRFR